MQLTSFVDIKENEANFQKALAENDNDAMWSCVYIACTNICKSIYAKRGFIASEEDLYDVIMDSTMMVMRNIKERDVKPEKLSSYCYLRCLCHVNGYKQDKFKKKLEVALSNINMNDYDYLVEELYEWRKDRVK